MLNQEHPLASTEMQLYGVGRAYEKTLQIDQLATFALCHPLGGLSTGGKPDIAAGQGLPQHMVALPLKVAAVASAGPRIAKISFAITKVFAIMGAFYPHGSLSSH